MIWLNKLSLRTIESDTKPVGDWVAYQEKQETTESKKDKDGNHLYYKHKLVTLLQLPSNDPDYLIWEGDIPRLKTTEELEPVLLERLNKAKEIRIDEISFKTGQLIESGYVYSGNLIDLLTNEEVTDIRFEISEQSKIHWFNIMYAYDKGRTGDFECRDIYGKSYLIPEADVLSFCDGIAQVVESIKLSGGNIKKQIHACTTIEQLDDIVDNR
jgi:hypothetical protein